jgi:uncharacterized protein
MKKKRSKCVMEFINSFHLSVWEWVWVFAAALFVGFSKTGISGFTMLVVPILANVFGGKDSTGILLPMLLIGDVFAIWYYNRHADWGNIKNLLPWTLVGLVAGTVVGNYISDKQFKVLIAVIVLICLALLIYTERKGENFQVPHKIWFFALTGIASGFASMIGNAAGPIMSIYLLAKGFNKNDFMGTFAWFFLIINLTKLPLQIFYWHNITVKTLIIAGGTIPAITVGALLGAFVIKKLKEKPFRYMVILMTAIAAVRLFL